MYTVHWVSGPVHVESVGFPFFKAVYHAVRGLISGYVVYITKDEVR